MKMMKLIDGLEVWFNGDDVDDDDAYDNDVCVHNFVGRPRYTPTPYDPYEPEPVNVLSKRHIPGLHE